MPASDNPPKTDRKSPARPRDGLRLVALDGEDLIVIASHLQDAVGQVRDMAFLPKERRFAALLNRFEWSGTAKPGAPAGDYERQRCALRFERVRNARVSGFSQKDKRLVLSLLTVQFEPAQEGEPGGLVTLVFAGGAAVRLEVECIEAELRDLGPSWRTKTKPAHPEKEA